MAGDWLKLESVTPDKPEVFEIATMLKIPPTDAFGRCFLIWRWFDQHTEDGNAANVTYAYLDHVAGVSGFAEAMRLVGWLLGGEGGCMGVTLPNFDRHNGNTAKSRALTARRVATHKKRIANAEVTHAPLPREEKRREEKRTPLPPSGAFLRFWVSWPKHHRKQSQSQCWEVWRKSDCDHEAEKISAHVDSLKAGVWLEEGGKFIPAPLVYLNQKWWEGAETPEKERTVAL
jgi:hypothetical protein